MRSRGHRRGITAVSADDYSSITTRQKPRRRAIKLPPLWHSCATPVSLHCHADGNTVSRRWQYRVTLKAKHCQLYRIKINQPTAAFDFN